MTTGRDIIAKKLKDYRDKHNINQFEFAEECGISRETLSLIERCRTNLTLDTLDLLAVRMNLTISELLSNDTIYFIIENTLNSSYGIGLMQNYKLADYAQNVSNNEQEVMRLINELNQKQMDIKQFHNLFCVAIFQISFIIYLEVADP